MGAARKALWYIESHFAENPSLAQIAEAVELSPFHLSRLFQVSTGTSMARYLRARRLTEAARTLAAGNVPILDVALAAGYASHAAFTHAFTEQFKQAPEQVRREGLQGLALVEAIKLDAPPLPCEVEPERRRLGPLRVAGIRARHTAATVASIPSQWQQLALTRELGKDVAFGVCCHRDGEGAFDYIAGMEIGASAAVPSAWHAVSIPAGDYLVAWHAGHISTIRSTWFWLLNDHLPGSGLTLADAPDFERYDARFDDRTGHGGVEIWLPLSNPS
ncbi:AraC family transcriptional regulator [Stenotrophomonas sp. SORGH_AS_0282]|jgi:AraC family transcriptional regulator|uniref:AraC family transcriptional regulator n=1 Tax=Stenotrophomonas TaxID=40323 RepID=UPI0027867273|nr:AraC family transcriptional regulator [Stenotrophomonas sp. SORGH_AS_0282]MDQ1062653.1 AraC family transcriptional regulator [Stenotrophomonas sp. SORGH_AS_0282]MDQ1188992.1 AraC family transcriptional regulator [Stenotrophomonas sp. SORGH_AS_0282]